MKKDIFIKVDDAKFKRFRYWSLWIDIAVFNFAGYSYLLQMRTNRMNKKIFRTAKLGSRYSSEHASFGSIEED